VGPQISRLRGEIDSCEQREDVYNSPEDIVDYWGGIHSVLHVIWEWVYRFSAESGNKFFFFF